ncbi:MAG: hypothetical protein A2Y40_09535 [Candidatus Margulisbacteria bacterium GWF2_35_9]|nr:MAG: hypothetical protein A2Y40_09535 [Candidatus Margulisbacteria bacterium GWF2_35_9]
MDSLDNKVIARIYGKGRGWSFSKIEFNDLAAQSTVGSILYRLEKKGTISRVIRGIYYYPKESTLVNENIPVDIPMVAEAIARKFDWEIIPSGETALNILGLTNQVPAKYTYMSNGKSNQYKIGKRELEFKKMMMKESNFKHSESNLIVQALRALGKENLSQEYLLKIRNSIAHGKHSLILKDTKSATGWIYEAIREVCK